MLAPVQEQPALLMRLIILLTQAMFQMKVNWLE
jgi:hypothetical protein